MNIKQNAAIEITKEDAFEELKQELKKGPPVFRVTREVRLSKAMKKEEFTSIRKELNLTQRELARELDLSIKTVQAYEQGRIEPSGLVAKVLRKMRNNSTFLKLFTEAAPGGLSENSSIAGLAEELVHLIKNACHGYEEKRLHKV